VTIAIDLDAPWLRKAASSDFQDEQVPPDTYFAVADEPGKRSYGIWNFDGKAVRRIDLPTDVRSPLISVPAGEDVAKTLRSTLGFYFTVQKLELPPGAFYPAMARPDAQSYGTAAHRAPDYSWRQEELTASLLQLRSLFQSLEGIFQVVHPAEQNLKTFGSSIRDLLILASTEC
jgi:hypothetical protein